MELEFAVKNKYYLFETNLNLNPVHKNTNSTDTIRLKKHRPGYKRRKLY